MNLIKINPEHYVIVDDSEIKEGDVVAEKLITGEYELFEIHNTNDIDSSSQKVITHSTQPFNCNCSNKGYRLDTNCAERNHCFDKIQYLSLQEVKELIGDVDVEKKAEISSEIQEGTYTPQHKITYKHGYQDGYNQALEDNKEKKYTEEDLRKAIEFGRGQILDNISIGIIHEQTDNFIQSLPTPKTQWEVTFDKQGKLRLV